MIHRFAILVFLLFSLARAALAVDHYEIEQNGQKRHLAGKTIVEAADGGVLVLTTDGAIWPVQPHEIKDRSRDDKPFEPLTQEQVGKALLAELPAGFQIHTTAHYVVCYNTSKAYAQWCGALYERLYRAFHTYWQGRGIKLHEPELPLVAVVFDDKASYARYAQAELGQAGTAIIGYYSLKSNRVVMYDLTGVETVRAGDRRTATATRINEILRQPEATRTVATIIHEATHQLSFNCGLQTRFADVPLWVSEGLANYFETPDLDSAAGWKTVGAVNPSRLQSLQGYLPQRPADSLETLLRDDKRFKSTADQALIAYGEAWALNYFLLRKYPDAYAKYTQQLAAKEPMFYDEPEERLQQFKTVFGDLKKLDSEFVLYFKKMKP